MVSGGAGLSYAHPLLFLFLVLAVWGFAARKRRLLGTALLLIFLAAWPPLAWLIAQSLEAWYAPQSPPTGSAGAIVVLAGAIIPVQPGHPRPSVKENTYLRCRYAAWLWSRSKTLPVLLCGGASNRVEVPAADVMRQVMIAEGVPPSMIWTEDRSTSTYENARFGAQILHENRIDRITLVTEAHHMLRSERCFRKQGLSVIPAPCNFSSVEASPNGWLPGGEGLLANEQTLHEFVGLAWYFLRGWI